VWVSSPYVFWYFRSFSAGIFDSPQGVYLPPTLGPRGYLEPSLVYSLFSSILALFHDFGTFPGGTSGIAILGGISPFWGGVYIGGGGEGGYIAGKLNLMFCCEGSPKSYVKFRGGLGGGVSIYRGGGKFAILGGFSVRRCHSPSDAILPFST
jgi:hypothetical protein